MSDFPNLQPTLLGERVIVRPVNKTDFDGLFAAASDPKIWLLHPEPTRYQRDVFQVYFDGAIQTKSAFVFVDRESQSIMGSSRYYGYSAERSEIEIGWTFLARDYWGGSYNREIKQLLIHHAFTFVDTVVFWVGETNARSRRAVEKIGGVLRNGLHVRAAGGDASHVIYDVTKDSFR